MLENLKSRVAKFNQDHEIVDNLKVVATGIAIGAAVVAATWIGYALVNGLEKTGERWNEVTFQTEEEPVVEEVIE